MCAINQYKNILNTIVQVPIDDIFVSWILCHMYLYVPKSQLNARGT